MSARIYALIPARGGSKGIPRKNLKPLAGQPLIAWTILPALRSGCFGRVLVSTDDEEIAATSRQLGAEVPFLRPPELASDTARSADVVLHALDWLRAHDLGEPDVLVILQPTSPLRTETDLQAALALVRSREAVAVASVSPAPHPPAWLRRINAQGELEEWLPAAAVHRRQDADALYQLNGALYAIRPARFRQDRTFLPPGTQAYVMPAERSLDIDTPWDFHLAELLLSHPHAPAHPANR